MDYRKVDDQRKKVAFLAVDLPTTLIIKNLAKFCHDSAPSCISLKMMPKAMKMGGFYGSHSEEDVSLVTVSLNYKGAEDI